MLNTNNLKYSKLGRSTTLTIHDESNNLQSTNNHDALLRNIKISKELQEEIDVLLIRYDKEIESQSSCCNIFSDLKEIKSDITIKSTLLKYNQQIIYNILQSCITNITDELYDLYLETVTHYNNITDKLRIRHIIFVD